MFKLWASRVGVAFSVLSLSTTVMADESEKCIESFEGGQRLRKEGKLRAASEALTACSQPSCPEFITKECKTWYSEVQASLPSVIVSARDGDQLIPDVRVSVDGLLLSEQSSGRAVPIDPGLREFVFELAGRDPLRLKVLIVEGEKNKQISAEFPAMPAAASPSVPPPGQPSAATEAPSPSALGANRTPVAAYVIGGAGLVLAGGGVALRLLAKGEYDDLEKSCKPTCSPADVDRVSLKYTLSDVALGVAGAALVTSGVLFLINGGSSDGTQTAVSLTLGRSGSGASVRWFRSF